jgi:hypothetical protein
MRVVSTAILLSFMTFMQPLNVSSQEKERGYKGNITKKELLSLIVEAKMVVGYIINGNDIIDIIKEDCTECEITVVDSIIEGGLDFTKIPQTLVNNSDWYSYHPVNNSITILGYF